jgi:hypothetical protein
MHSTNIEQVSLTTLGLALLETIHRTHPQHMNEERLNAASPLIGSRRVLDAVRNNDLLQAVAIAEKDAQQFRDERAAYLLYD